MNRSVTVSVLKIWLGHAISWLRINRNTGSLQPPHQQMLDLMNRARKENHPNDVWEIIEQLEELAIQAGIQEQGEIYLNCAKMAADLENLREATRLCVAAETKLRSYPHQHGVALWMLGCIQWASHQRVKAISSWRGAIQTFRARQTSLQLDSKRVVWYDQIIPNLEAYLAKAIEEDILPDFDDDSLTNMQPNGSGLRGQDDLRWITIPVSDSVPAGGFRPVGHDQDVSYMSAVEVLIENEKYTVHSVKRNSLWRNSVNVRPSTQYHVLMVTGNSMNAASPVPIDSDDYIFVRAQNHADDNDIVVASLNETDPVATVKRFHLVNGRISLRPESHDLDIQNSPQFAREFSSSEVRINGVVEAVFKKKSD